MRAIKMFLKFCEELGRETLYVLDGSAKYVGNFVIVLCPYMMLAIGMAIGGQKGKVLLTDGLWWVLLLPIVLLFLAKYVKYYADMIGKGDICPIPDQRFTEVDNDGMVTVKYDRMQEMLLYVADVEDYLERKGLL